MAHRAGGLAAFNDAVEQFLDEHDVVVVIEQNRDEHLRKLLLRETECAKEKLVSITDYGGQPLSKGHVLEGVAPYLEVATVEAS